MVVMISGGSGLVGSALTARWKQAGHDVYQLKRGTPSTHRFHVAWDVPTGQLTWPTSTPPKIDTFIHLAGVGITDHRWSPAFKNEIRSSRVDATQRLVAHLLQHGPLPRRFIGASAVGIYGNRSDELLTESSNMGTGFLAETCHDWENSANPLRTHGTIVSHLRLGVVLSPQGGALAKQLPIFRLGLGGRLGRGTQWLSWISLEDVLQSIDLICTLPASDGPYNIVAPEHVTNATFTRALAATLHRPAILPVSGVILRLAMGEMAEALLLVSQRVLPGKLVKAGFNFKHPSLVGALQSLKLTT